MPELAHLAHSSSQFTSKITNVTSAVSAIWAKTNYTIVSSDPWKVTFMLKCM